MFFYEIHKIEKDQKNRDLMINSSISEFLIKQNEWIYPKSLKNRKLLAVWDEFLWKQEKFNVFLWDSQDDLMINSSISEFLIKENE